MALKTVNTTLATIQMRHGAEELFDPDQMTTGEWAVSTDKKYVRMCFAPGIVARMATYEAFEQDMKEIQIILATCQDIQVAVERFAELARQHETQAEEYSTLSKSWAVGGTGTRDGEDSDNAKYYYEQTRNISQGLGGALLPMGTVSFVNLPALSDAGSGWMYNVSDQFSTTGDFNEGAGKVIPAGANVYKTADGKWDVLAGTPVTTVNGQTGNVNITAESIGSLPKDGNAKSATKADQDGNGNNISATYLKNIGDASQTTVTFEQAAERANVQSGDDLETAFAKLSKYCADLKQVAFSGKYIDLEGKLTLTNNLLATQTGTALDAVQGKVLNDKITQINSDLAVSGSFETWLYCHKIRGFGVVLIIPRTNNRQRLSITYIRVFCNDLAWHECTIKAIRYASSHVKTQFLVIIDTGEYSLLTDGLSYLCDVRGEITID